MLVSRQRRLRGRLQRRRRRGIGRSCCSSSIQTTSLRRASATRSSCRSSRIADGEPGRDSSPPRGGTRINTAGNVVHFTGIAWAGGAGRPRGEAPRVPGEVAFPSGACLAIPRETFARDRRLQRALLPLPRGHRPRASAAARRPRSCGIEPRAICDHDYEFDKGAAKWRYLERNRWATIIRDLPRRRSSPCCPARPGRDRACPADRRRRDGRLASRSCARTSSTVRSLPRLIRERRRVQATARSRPASFARQPGGRTRQWVPRRPPLGPALCAACCARTGAWY